MISVIISNQNCHFFNAQYLMPVTVNSCYNDTIERLNNIAISDISVYANYNYYLLSGYYDVGNIYSSIRNISLYQSS